MSSVNQTMPSKLDPVDDEWQKKAFWMVIHRDSSFSGTILANRLTLRYFCYDPPCKLGSHLFLSFQTLIVSHCIKIYEHNEVMLTFSISWCPDFTTKSWYTVSLTHSGHSSGKIWMDLMNRISENNVVGMLCNKTLYRQKLELIFSGT